MWIFHDKRKYLLVVALLILALICAYFSYAFQAQEERLVREKAWEKQQDVALLCGIVDRLVEMDRKSGNAYGYEDVLTYAVQAIEESYYLTFARAWDDGLNPLTELHPGAGGGQKHDPMDYPEFIEAVKKSRMEGDLGGSLTYWYETEEVGGRTIYITYRWVPTNAADGSRYLVAVGISKYTIVAGQDPAVIYGALAMIAISAIYIMVSSVLLVRLGHIYDQRQGVDKWRGKG